MKNFILLTIILIAFIQDDHDYTSYLQDMQDSYALGNGIEGEFSEYYSTEDIEMNEFNIQLNNSSLTVYGIVTINGVEVGEEEMIASGQLIRIGSNSQIYIQND